LAAGVLRESGNGLSRTGLASQPKRNVAKVEMRINEVWKEKGEVGLLELLWRALWTTAVMPACPTQLLLVDGVPPWTNIYVPPFL